MRIAKRRTAREPDSESFRKLSFSQAGEDLIIKFIFEAIGIARPTYMDIGAHHPNKINNTALFYMLGSRGINIEPDPELFLPFTKERQEDTNLNIGITQKPGSSDLYILSSSSLNTFSKQEAKKYESEGFSVVNKVRIKTKNINSVIRKYMGEAPDLLTLDVEGMDYEVIKSLDFDKYSPKVVCVETISFSQSGRGKKDHRIIKLLETKGYLLYADTYINSIFVQRALWER